MHKPRVTIVMPVYNGGQYFRLALQSALRQSYENIQIVVVNDGSTDNGETEAIALEQGSRIVYVRQDNKGVAGALNTGITRMTGDYFTWLSHDYIHLPNKVERQLDFLSRLGKPDAMLISDYELIDRNGQLIDTARLPHQNITETPMLPLMHGMINGCTVFIAAGMMRQYGPFDERLRYTQDYDLWNRMLMEHEFFHQPEVLIQYRMHPGQDSHKPAAIGEGDELWIRILETRNEAEQVQMFGSRRRYFATMARFLDNTPYARAAAYAQNQVSLAISRTFVSIVVPFWNEVGLACRAARSALAQTYENIEVIAIDDGSTESIAELEELARQDRRLRIFRQENAGAGAARNQGIREAAGEYIAFLDADDMFLPHKIQRQIQLMQQGGHLLSHTSYYVSYPERFAGLLGVMRSGAMSGQLYPQIIAGCPIAMPTVMLHRSILTEGFEFPTQSPIGEDVVAWIDLAMRHAILGIDEPLSVVEWSPTTTALSCEKMIIGLSYILASVQEHPIHRRQVGEIVKLKASVRQTAHRWKSSLRVLPEPLVAAGFEA
jgi:glycosyltransferase involved in cell wall biosynthesis